MTDRYAQRLSTLRDLIDDAGIEHFAADELVEHTRSDWPGPRIFPPRERLLDHIAPTVKIADEIRDRWGGPVVVVSGYRAPYYNDELVEGSDRSQHMDFRALDLQPADGEIGEFIDLVEQVVQARRGEGQIIGLGRYPTFVHIDTGHYDYQRNWDQR